MEKTEILSVGRDMIYLASCAFHSRIPEKETLLEMNIARVYKMAKFHSMQSIIYICLANCVKKYGEEIVDAQIFKRFAMDYQGTVQKLVKFDVEREALCELIGEHDWYLCLKGVVMQNYYPTLGMRQMADNDILVGPKSYAPIRDYFVKRGYEVHSYGKGCHDTYFKGAMNFEIHRKLFSSAAKTRQGWDYYKTVKDKLIPGKKQGEMLFTDDDFYVYFLYHAYKHYATAGCGVRTLMDIYAYYSKNERLDAEYIAEQLSVLGIAEYESNSRKLAFALFSPNATPKTEIGEEMTEMLLYYLTSGTFGTQTKMVENSLSDASHGDSVTLDVKLKYILGRLFPPYSFYREGYPRLSKLIFPIPFLWLIRLSRIITRRKAIADEVNKVKEI